jgi:hypothetical protein
MSVNVRLAVRTDTAFATKTAISARLNAIAPIATTSTLIRYKSEKIKSSSRYIELKIITLLKVTSILHFSRFDLKNCITYIFTYLFFKKNNMIRYCFL